MLIACAVARARLIDNFRDRPRDGEETNLITIIIEGSIELPPDLDDLLVRCFEIWSALAAFRLVAASLKGGGRSERKRTLSARHLSSRMISACDKRIMRERSYKSFHSSESATNGSIRRIDRTTSWFGWSPGTMPGILVRASSVSIGRSIPQRQRKEWEKGYTLRPSSFLIWWNTLMLVMQETLRTALRTRSLETILNLSAVRKNFSSCKIWNNFLSFKQFWMFHKKVKNNRTENLGAILCISKCIHKLWRIWAVQHVICFPLVESLVGTNCQRKIPKSPKNHQRVTTQGDSFPKRISSSSVCTNQIKNMCYFY